MKKNIIRAGLCAALALTIVNCGSSGTTPSPTASTTGTPSVATTAGASSLATTVTTQLGSLSTAVQSSSPALVRNTQSPVEVAHQAARFMATRETVTDYPIDTFTYNCGSGGDVTFGGNMSYDDGADTSVYILDVVFNVDYNNCLEEFTAYNYTDGTTCDVSFGYDGAIDYDYHWEAANDYTAYDYDGTINSPSGPLTFTINGTSNTIEFVNFSYTGSYDQTAGTYSFAYSGNIIVNGVSFDAATFSEVEEGGFSYCE